MLPLTDSGRSATCFWSTTVPEVRSAAFHQRRRARDLHRLLHRAHLQRDIERQRLRNIHTVVLAHVLAKSLGFALNFITPERQSAHRIVACFVGVGCGLDTGVLIGDRDGGAGDHGAAGVGHAAQDRPSILSPTC